MTAPGVVVFDVGETLVDETRYWADWAERLGVPALTLFALLGAAIERGEHHRTVLARCGAEPSAGFAPPRFSRDDLYPDALAALSSLRERGVRVAIAGNVPTSIAAAVREWDLPVEAVLGAEELGAEKPDPEFFRRVAEALGVATDAIVYVGDRIDNDVEAAGAAGCRSVWIRRGPWAAIQGRTSTPSVPTIDGLEELVTL